MLRSRILFCDMLKCWCFIQIPTDSIGLTQLFNRIRPDGCLTSSWTTEDGWVYLGLFAFKFDRRVRYLGKVTLGPGSQTSLIRLLVPKSVMPEDCVKYLRRDLKYKVEWAKWKQHFAMNSWFPMSLSFLLIPHLLAPCRTCHFHDF